MLFVLEKCVSKYQMEPVIIQKQIFNMSESKDFILLQLIKIMLGIFLLIMMGIIGNQIYNGNIDKVTEQIFLPIMIISMIYVFNKMTPFKLFAF
jgi:hypothetical protein